MARADEPAAKKAEPAATKAPPAANKAKPANKKAPPAKCYTDPQQTDADFEFQGEYVGESTQADGAKIKLAKCSVKLNGVLILDDVDILYPTGSGTPERPEPESTYLQYHGLPVFFRNVWLVEKK
jgi:hypothetical protein